MLWKFLCEVEWWESSWKLKIFMFSRMRVTDGWFHWTSSSPKNVECRMKERLSASKHSKLNPNEWRNDAEEKRTIPSQSFCCIIKLSLLNGSVAVGVFQILESWMPPPPLPPVSLSEINANISHNPHFTIQNPQFTLHNLKSKIHTPQFTIHNPQSTHHNQKSTLALKCRNLSWRISVRILISRRDHVIFYNSEEKYYILSIPIRTTYRETKI